MKTLLSIVWLAILLLFSSCEPPKTFGLIMIDLNKAYLEKTIQLSDIAEVSYVQLDDSNEDFLFRGGAYLITRDYIIVPDYKSGDVFFFTRDGKPKSKFNRKGEGPDEYRRLLRIQYDEKKDDLLMHDLNKINVYSSSGVYKRSYPLPERSVLGTYAILDDLSLLLFDMLDFNTANIKRNTTPGSVKRDEENKEGRFQSSFVRLSRKDGSVQEYIQVPEQFYEVDLTVSPGGEGSSFRVPGQMTRISKHKDGLLLYSQEADTIFLYDRNYTLSPFIVQTPSVKTNKPATFINSIVDLPGYQFLQTNTVELMLPGPLKTANLFRDKKDGTIYRPKIFLSDFEGKEFTINQQAYSSSLDVNEVLLSLTIDELLEANSSGRLKGKLKDFVDSMNKENENDVLLLLQFK